MNSKATVGNYDIGRTLGEGTFGKVKLGFHRQVQELVAVKVLFKQRITDKADVERVTREISILKAVSHPGVIRLFEILETPDEICLVMEYAQQGDMADYIRRRDKIPEKEAAAILFEIISALEYLHSIGVAHRDLKPSNILIGKQNHIKLADFGLSNMYAQGTKLHSPCGSPCYAAPEVIEGKAYEPLLADIWSTGVVLFMMIAGHLPYQHKNTHSLYKLILNARYEVPKGMSRLAADLIATIFKTNPQKRARLAEIRNHPWMMLHLGDHKIAPLPPHQLLLNDRILQVLSRAGHKIQDVLTDIKRNRHGSLSTLYHLYSLKTPQQLDQLLDLSQPATQPKKLLTIDLRSPSDASSSARKLLKRTPRNSTRRSTSKQPKDSSDAFRGAYQKLVRLNGSSSSVNSITTNSIASFYSKVTKCTDSKLATDSFKLDSSKLEASKLDQINSVRAQTSRTSSIERRVSIERTGVKSRRFSFVKRGDQRDALDVYDGPFGIDSVFVQDPLELKLRIMNYARLHRLVFKELDRWMFEVKASESDQATISIHRLSNAPKALILRMSCSPDCSIPRKLLTFLHS